MRPHLTYATLLFFLLLFATSLAQAQVSVTATGGTTGPTSYTTVKGAFDAINLGTHTGVIAITVSASTTETATAALNASGSGSASYTRVMLKPAASATPTITGSIAGAPIILLNGASNVTIDGSNSGTAVRSLTIGNTSTTTPQVVVIGSLGSTSINGDTLKNCTITNGSQTSSAIIVSDAATPGNAGYFTNIGIVNNSIQKAYIGLYVSAAPAGTNGNGTWIANNSLNTSGTSSIRYIGIYAQGIYGAQIDSNTVGNFESASAEFDRGIWLASGTTNTSVTGNTVTALSYTGTTAGYAPIGINVSPAVTNAAVSITGNTVYNISSSSTGNSIGIYFYSSASGVTINRNKISDIKNSNSGGYGAAGIWLTGTLTTSAVSVLNNFVWDVAAYGTNSWTASSNGNGIVADGGGGYNIYYNTVWLGTNQTATTGTRAAPVLITANVTASNCINLRDNLLVNTQTVGNGNSRMAFVITASTGVLNTCNYNDYYASSGNLVGQGTNATIWNTISQIQTNIGLNANSVSIQPTFTSSTDLHLPAASNNALNNLGVSIATITSDIDGDPRTSTPDMGADEFGNCLAVTITSQPVATTKCEGAPASFSVAATNGNIIQWQVNSGSGFTNISNGGIYAGATTGTLTLASTTAAMTGYIYRAQVSNSISCPVTNSNAVPLTINPIPSVTVTPNGATTFCTGGSVTLNVPVATNVTYQWYNGTGAINGATASSYMATTSGNYYVTATNSISGCPATSASTVVAVGGGPAAAITPSGTSAICQGNSITLSAGTALGVSYQWKSSGSAIPGATGNTYTTSAGGVYTVDVYTSGTCSNTSTAAIVNVNPLPTATASTASPAICQGNTTTISANVGTGLSYQWLLGVGPLAGEITSNFITGLAGSYRVKVTSGITGCSDTSAPVAITINPLPPASITSAAAPAICERDTSVLTANTGMSFTYQWLFNGSSIIGANGNSYKAFADGNYSVEIIDANGCKKTSSPVPLLVHPAPPAAITYSSPLQFCEGSAVALNVFEAPNLSYQWYKDGSILTGVTGTNYVVYTSGTFYITTKDNFNCTNTSLNVPVTVNPRPQPVVSMNGGMLGTTGTYVTYQWFLNNNAIGAGGSSPAYTPAENGAYKVIVTDAAGCTGTSELYFIMNVGVGNLTAADAQIRVSPNPASDFINVENGSALHPKRLSLISSIGAIVATQEVNGRNAKMMIGDRATGLYYLRIETDSGVLLRKIEVVR